MVGVQRYRWFVPGLLALSGGWAAAIAAAPWISQTSPIGAAVGSAVYLAGSLICHQLADRSFYLSGVQLPVCARCTGLYVGGATGVVAWLVWRRAQRRPILQIDPQRVVLVLLVAGAPTAITWATAIVGLWDLSNVGRAALALPLGLAAGAVLAAVASNDLS